MKKILGVLLIVSISLSFLVISLERNTYNIDYYLDSYEKYEIEEVTGKSIVELEAITDKLILYLKGKGGEELLKPHYNEREITHMVDVQNLFKLARLIKYIGLIISFVILFYLFTKREYNFLEKTLTLGLFSNHIIIIVLTILASINFNKYFTYFHLIFFDNDLWILDHETDLLIQMLPVQFFMGIAFKIVLSFLLYLTIIQIISYFGVDEVRTMDRRYSTRRGIKLK